VRVDGGRRCRKKDHLNSIKRIQDKGKTKDEIEKKQRLGKKRRGSYGQGKIESKV